MFSGLDNLHNPEGVIALAQQAASEVFGAAHTHFLVNGSTCGILAAVSACCGPGAILVTSRAGHVSIFNAAAIAGVLFRLRALQIVCSSDCSSRCALGSISTCCTSCMHLMHALQAPPDAASCPKDVRTTTTFRDALLCGTAGGYRRRLVLVPHAGCRCKRLVRPCADVAHHLCQLHTPRGWSVPPWAHQA